MLYLPIGIPGSGKSTLVRQHFSKSEIVCPDEIREWLTDDVNDQTENNLVFEIVHNVVYKRLALGLDVVVDATNLEPKFWPDDLGQGTTLILMSTTIDQCHEWNESRERVVPLHAMQRMAGLFLKLWWGLQHRGNVVMSHDFHR